MDEWLCRPRNRAGSRAVTVLIAIRQGPGGRSQGWGEGKLKCLKAFFLCGRRVRCGGGGSRGDRWWWRWVCVSCRSGKKQGGWSENATKYPFVSFTSATSGSVQRTQPPPWPPVSPNLSSRPPAPKPQEKFASRPVPPLESEPLSQFSQPSPLPSPFTLSSPAPALRGTVVLATPCSRLAPSLLCSRPSPLPVRASRFQSISPSSMSLVLPCLLKALAQKTPSSKSNSSGRPQAGEHCWRKSPWCVCG